MGQLFIDTLKWLFLTGEMPEYPWCRGFKWRSPVVIKPPINKLVIVFFRNERGDVQIRGATFTANGRFVDSVYGNKFDYEVQGWLPLSQSDLTLEESPASIPSVAAIIRFSVLVTAMAGGVTMIANSMNELSRPEELFMGTWLTMFVIAYIAWAFAHKKLL